MKAFPFCALVILFNGVSIAYTPEIPITVLNSWEITYSSDIQDISYNWNTQQIAIRSNGDGKIYLADPNDLSLEGTWNLPSGIQGFGLNINFCYPSGGYYINSTSQPNIYYSDTPDSWTAFPNPAGIHGAGMDFTCVWDDWQLFQASAEPPYCFYAINPDDSTFSTYDLPGVIHEISGFMVHDIMTLDEYLPYAIIATTRFGHEFFFWHSSPDGYVLYGQENCPLPVDESLGLLWNIDDMTVFWSYLGTDGKYYISELEIPVFGGIEDFTCELATGCSLSTSSNPARGTASISVSLDTAESVSLGVYDISGRLQKQLFNGILDGGITSWNVTIPGGVYTVLLKTGNRTETLRFAVTD